MSAPRTRKLSLVCSFYSMMPQGRCWRIAALATLAMSFSMAGTPSPAIGLELAVPTLSSSAAAPEAPQSTSLLSASTQLPSGPLAPEVPALPTAPTLPVAPQLTEPASEPAQGERKPSSTDGSGTATRAAAPTQVRKSQRSRGGRPGPREGGGDAGSAPRLNGAGGLRAERASVRRASPRDRSRARESLPLIFGNPVDQVQSASPFGQLGRPVEQSPVSELVRSFGGNSTAGAAWAPPLLAIMLLIGVGGFLRASRVSRRASL
jgi:hypothetical protein